MAASGLIDLFGLKDLLNKYGTEITKEMITRLTSKGGGVTTGVLYSHIQYHVTDTPNGPSLAFTMPAYGNFVDQGVNGTQMRRGSPFSFKSKMVNVGAIKLFCQAKGIPEKAAFPIAVSIAQKGLPRTGFFRTPILRRQAALIHDMEFIMTPQVQKKIAKFLNSNV